MGLYKVCDSPSPQIQLHWEFRTIWQISLLGRFMLGSCFTAKLIIKGGVN